MKKNGTVRTCVDYRKRNYVTKKDAFPVSMWCSTNVVIFLYQDLLFSRCNFLDASKASATRPIQIGVER
jgi:hypothetical protein